jgi:hypothetical protein
MTAPTPDHPRSRDPRQPAPRRANAGVLAALVVVLLGAALVVVRADDDGPERGGGRLEVDGTAVVERAGGDEEVVTGGTDVGPGDRVRVTDGTARLAVRGGTLELRAAHGDAEDSTVVIGEVPELEAGAVLVTTDRSMSLSSAGTDVHVGAGAATVSRTLGMSVTTYQGASRIDSASQERDVPALRAMAVPALGRPPRAALPLAYDASDPWDRRYLAGAIELGERLEALARGYTDNLAPGEGTTVAFYRSVLPGLADEPDLTSDLLEPARPAGETLVGAAITELGERGSFAERWRATFGFRDEGAAWGLVALDQGVDRTPLLGSVELALEASPLPFEGSPSPASPDETPAPVPAPGGPAPTTTALPPPPPPPPPPTTAAPPPPPPPTTAAPSEPAEVPGGSDDGTLSPALEPVVEPTNELLGGLLDTLVGP